MIEAVKMIYELLSRLIRIKYERRRKIFDDILKPISEKFILVNAEYRTMFNATLDKIPLHYDKDKTHWFLPNGEIVQEDNSKLGQHIQILKNEFLTKRSEREHIRDELRYRAHTILAAVKGQEERRFLLALLYYFLEDGPSPDSNQSLDTMIEVVLEEGGNSALRTPSARLALDIENTNNPTELRRLFSNAVTNLDQRFAVVCCRFAELQLAIINETATGG